MTRPGGSKKKLRNGCMARAVAYAPSIADLLEAAKQYRLNGKNQEALAQYEVILQQNPNLPDALHNLGLMALEENDFVKAETLIQRSISSDPANSSNSYFWVNLSLVFKAQKKFQEALDCLLKALELQPDNAFAFLNLGVTQVAIGLDDDAIANYRQAIAINPDFKEAFYNLGIALREKEQHFEAIQCNERVIELDPNYVDAYINIAASNISLKNFDAVAAYSMAAIKINPQNYNSYFNLGIACHEQGNLEGSRLFLEYSAALNPGYMNTHCARSLVMLALGKLDEGWKGYEYRWYKETDTEPMRHYPYPWWLGESLQDKTIFVWGEQGIGDQMMFSSMLDDLIGQAKKCIVACNKKLIPLFERSFPGAIIIDLENKDQLARWHSEIDVQSALGSMARWLRPTLAHFPKKTHFLTADPERVLYWKTRLAQMGPELNVGICWRSGNMSGDRPFYCTKIEQWAPIFSVPGVRFVNLQYDDCASELARAKALFGVGFGVDIAAFAEVDLFNDIDEAAALSKAVDLVISAPTTVSILSAALGVPTWQMVSGFNWQLMGASENRWYSSLKTIQREWNQPWDMIIQNMADMLQISVKEVHNEKTRA